ncbi:vacuolar ATP synthase subunit S1-domain-containing protein [Sporodiniella umbellata]|nr:vacuolar ATP synthase subunit S1-domain-containing protein [Sporodiniella umbellata]
MKINSIALFSTLVSTVVAFDNTVPCVLWSPKDYINPNTQTQHVMTHADAATSILSSLSHDICSAKVIALFNQPELHSNDLTRPENKHSFEQLKARVENAHSHSSLEYITDGVDIQQVAQKLAIQCNTQISYLDASTISTDDFPEQDKPIVAIVSLSQTNDLNKNNALLEQVMRSIPTDDYAAVYTSSSPKATLRRRAPVEEKLPIFAKYQLFTPGVFMVLGVSLLFMFIAGVGITWLSGIQTPIRMEAPKQKKN